jgi:16S rRNA (guanine966-N2)-methyltransferase
MRVIAGSAKGVPLRPPSSDGTRPIAGRAKEALFSILHPVLPGARFADVFAGTGAVGIEALSRGAAEATFVELSPVAVGDLRHNLERTGLADRAKVVYDDAFAFLARCRDPYDVVFLGPPQWQDLWAASLEAVDERPECVAGDGLVVVQCDPREVRDLPLRNLERTSERRYGNVALLFHDLRPPP